MRGTSPLRTRGLAALCAGMIWGCGGADSAVDPRGHAASIVNGAPTTGDPAVVQLHLQTTGGETIDYCSGSLIAPDRVLTAAHCVAPMLRFRGLAHPLTSIQVYFGSDSSQPPGAGGAPAWRSARSWVANPHAPDRDPPADPYVGQYDTAVVFLSEPAPAGIEPLPVSFDLPGDGKALMGMRARIVGFGATEIRDGESGESVSVGLHEKRHGDARLIGISEFENEEGAPFDFLVGTLDAEAAAGDVAAGCKGDSGGPLLLEREQGQWSIAAVTSWGDPGCVGIVHYAPLTASRDFLRPFLE